MEADPSLVRYDSMDSDTTKDALLAQAMQLAENEALIEETRPRKTVASNEIKAEKPKRKFLARMQKKRPCPPVPAAASNQNEAEKPKRKFLARMRKERLCPPTQGGCPMQAKCEAETKEPEPNPKLDRWSDRFQATVVVPKSHETCQLSASNKVNWVPRWNKSSVEVKLATDAVLVDYRPTVNPKAWAVLTLWNSKTVHCGGHSPKKGFPGKGYLHKGACKDGHFLVDDVKGWKTYLEENGFCVVELGMTEEQHDELLKHFRRSVQLMNKATMDNKNPTCPKMEEITQKHLPPYLGKGLQSFYGMCNTPFADHMRLHPEVRSIFEQIYGTKDLYCSLDAPAVSISAPNGKCGNWLHQDQDAKHTYLSVQGNLILKSQYARLSQMVSYQPLERFSDEMRSLCESCRKVGSSMTHDNARVNKKPIPAGRPNPNLYKHLRVYNEGAAEQLGDTEYNDRYAKFIPPKNNGS